LHLKSKFTHQTDHDGMLILICTTSIFLPFYLCALPVFLLFINILLNNENKIGIFTPRHSGWFYAFATLGVAVGIIHQHWLGVFTFGFVIIMFLLAFYIQSIMTKDLCYNIIFIISIGSIVAAIDSFIQKYPDFSFRSVSFFGNANYYAYVCELLIVVLVYTIYEYGARPLYFAAIVANLGGIFASGCRTAWLAFFIGSVVVMLCLKKYRHVLIMAGIALLTGIGIYLVPQFIFPRYGKFDNDKTLRLLIWKTAFGFIKTHPFFGQGMLTYLTLSTGRAHDAHAHDLILEFLLNYGIIGTAIITIYAVLLLRDLIKNIRINTACAAVIGVVAATFVHGITDLPFIGPQTGTTLVIMLSIAGICGKYANRKSEPPDQKNSVSSNLI
jgi:O-antigen ligase